MKKKKHYPGLIPGITAAAAVIPILCILLFSWFPEEQILLLKEAASRNDPAGMAAVLTDLTKLTAEQYRNILIASPDYLFRFWNSVKLVLPITVLQMIISVSVSYGIMLCRKRTGDVLLLLYLLLMLTPVQAAVVPNYFAIKKLHLLGTDYAIWLPGIFSPFPVYLLTKTMRKIPKEVIEAARTDGAGQWKVLTRIVIPQAKGPIIALGLLVLAEYWNMVELPLIMYTNPSDYPLSVYLSRIREDAFGLSFAASVIYLIPILLLVIYAMDDLKEGISVSSL